MKKPDSNTLVVGIIISVCILIILFYIQLCFPLVLKIESRWLLLASAPIVLALLLGGYIKSIKAKDFEVELVREAVSEHPSIIVMPRKIIIKQKGSHEYLENIKNPNRVEALKLIYRKQGYYDFNVLSEYLHVLKKVNYLYIVDDEDKFHSIIQIDQERNDIDNRSYANRIISYVEGRRHHENEHHIHWKITELYISEKESISNAIRDILKSSWYYLPVLDEESKIVGIVTLKDLTRKLLEAIDK